ncbi:gastrula zinc finger protein XlCGF7.1-like [Mercenaria mercenaria]|uniref:gastrula zinc finger protein XlCGF7.1-like n=1 Tax=Mercenaria mercenaria TaxID=6596 RepID=UPI00234E4422|nr:gastrula zinc finger protein XlCGF7.1-like [Mercenaria mercenaria]
MEGENNFELEADEPLDGSLLDISIEEEVDNEVFDCGICSKSYKTKDNLKRHLKVHDDKYKFSCTCCTLFFTTEHEYNVHKQLKHSTSFLCITCGKTFSRKAHLTDHAALHEPAANPDKVQVCPFDACRKKFTKKTRYQDHMNIHTGVKPYECSCCQRKFHGRYAKNQHERVCAGVVENRCEVCSSVFTDKSTGHGCSHILHHPLNSEVFTYNLESIPLKSV